MGFNLCEATWCNVSLKSMFTICKQSPNAGLSKTGTQFSGDVQAWRDEPKELRAWQRGRTGFPLVDAGMRELWATGWMQQSVRMVCAAFLVEYLSLHWVHGCRCAAGAGGTSQLVSASACARVCMLLS